MIKSALVIGLGSIGRRHLRNLASCFPKATLSVLRHRASPDPEAECLGVTLYSDPNKALSARYDLIILATPSANHIDLLPRLIEMGCNLLVEKPIVANLGDCDRIEKVLDTSPPAIRAAGFNFRYLPSLQYAQALISGGALGQLTRASLTAGLWLPDWRPGQDYTQGYSADAARGGGVELDLVHEIDVARWFFGDLTLDYACGRHLSALQIEANDTSLMVLHPIGKGPLVQIALDYVSRQRVRHYEVVGDMSGLTWNLMGTLLKLTPDGVVPLKTHISDFDVSQTYLDMLKHVAKAIEDPQSPPPQGLEDGIASTRLALQARDQGSLL